ncbi:putative N-acetyltransferase ycf52 [Ananas comosus]|uniref:Putative N-acetyltransferase ycf52 n=1 Tax=Ananas comosus TaxID=4615 RepID=A0A199VS82_ANACO|nr:putative N-acetyltransferase ycf52 [Ananas comosus]
MHSHSFLRTLPFPTHSPKPFLALAAASSSSSGSGFELSVSDAELASRGFAVRRDAEGLDVGALNDVFARVGFPRRDPARLRRALAAAAPAAPSCGSRPRRRRRRAGGGLGLGRAVVERVVAELRRKGVGNIALYAEPRVVGFYRPLGFAADPDGIRGMVYSRKNQKRNR